MQLAGLKLDSPFLAAPMAGVSSPVWRLMARQGGAALVYTEMVSAVGLLRRQPQTLRLMRSLPGEQPAALQLFGADPEVMGRAAKVAAGLDYALIDLNLGCPVRKVRRQGAGSALLDDPVRAAEVTAAVVENAGRPVTVKLRLGYDADTTEEVVPGLVRAGAAAVCLHARTVRQGYAGQADWQAIARLKSWCPLPVIGNGDAKDAASANAMLAQTGCDLVMIGRGALADPWVFGQAADLWAGREAGGPTAGERLAAYKQHAFKALELGGSRHAVHFFRQCLMNHTKGRAGAPSLRRAVGMAADLERLMALADELFERLEREAA